MSDWRPSQHNRSSSCRRHATSAENGKKKRPYIWFYNFHRASMLLRNVSIALLTAHFDSCVFIMSNSSKAFSFNHFDSVMLISNTWPYSFFAIIPWTFYLYAARTIYFFSMVKRKLWLVLSLMCLHVIELKQDKSQKKTHPHPA